MLEGLSGRTRLYGIIGDPIAQVKSPAGVTRTLEAEGLNAVCIPMHVSPDKLHGFVEGLSAAQNLDGLMITIPHKFAAYDLCATSTARASLLRAVNTMRRNADGSWHGDMLDGEAFVQAQVKLGAQLQASRALLVGAGGAGSAIGLALIAAGVTELVIHDSDQGRVARLVDRLSGQGASVTAGPADPAGCSMVCNATPAGMATGDPLPVAADDLRPSMFVGDVITVPEVTPLLLAARAAGCKTATGVQMFGVVQHLMVDFLLAR